MRRKDKQIHDAGEIESIINGATVCRIALSLNDVPYLVPVNYGFKDNCLYFHSAPEGRKIEILKQNDRVCFEMEMDVEVIEGSSPCKWGTKYRSVIGQGRASFIEAPEEKKKALDAILAHYGGQGSEYPEKTMAAVVVVKIEIESLTGKRSGF